MDSRTLIITGLTVSLSVNLSMAIVWWTRRTWPGFGHWLAGGCARSLGGLLILLSRDEWSPVLTILLANGLLLAELLLYVHGTCLFRGRPVRRLWYWALGLPFLALFAWFTWVQPDIAWRITVLGLWSIGIDLWLVRLLLADRPPWFGSVDLWQAGVWALLALLHLGRIITVWLLAERPPDLLTLPLVQNLWLLLLVVATLLVALSQIIMNAQRLEYELRQAGRRLEQAFKNREAMDAALRESEEKFRLAFTNANVGMTLVSLEGRLLQVNQKMCDLFGYSGRAMVGMHVNDLTLPEDRGVSRRFIDAALAGGAESATFEKRYRHRDGRVIHGLVASSLVRGADGRPRCFITQVLDISERKHYEAALREARDTANRTKWALRAANEQLQQLATTDMLTGAWNRRWFEDRLAEAMTRAWRQPEPMALVMFDLDHFKEINDSLGHAAGDEVLIELVRRVRERLRAVDLLARWGGEEFVLLLTDCPEDAALRLAEEQRERIATEPIAQVGTVPASFGVAAWRAEENAQAWFKRADDALYVAKRAGRNRVCVG